MAEPPAESPSTMKISVRVGSFSRQSASLPGIRLVSSALLRRTSSRAFLAAALFNDPTVNRAHAQLIISAHTMELLSPDILRRDQIYFTEKKRKTGISELYSLDEFSLRKGENVRKAYLLGRYGAVPDIPEGALL